MTLPTIAQLRELLRYEPETGALFWLERPRAYFRSERDWKAWNTKYAHCETFTFVDPRGYVQGAIFNTRRWKHRVIWALEKGEWPEAVIDHIDGDPGNNRIENLRAVPQQVNCRNARFQTRNTSGAKGVRWHAGDKKWHARMGMNYKELYLGSFDVYEDAVAARRAAEIEHGFTERSSRPLTA